MFNRIAPTLLVFIIVSLPSYAVDLNRYCMGQKKPVLGEMNNVRINEIKSSIQYLKSHKIVKKHIDGVLQKLAKSNIAALKAWKRGVRSRTRDFNDSFFEEFISAYPTGNLELDKVLDTEFKRLGNRLFDEERRKAFINLFSAVKKDALFFINRLKLNIELKEKLKKRIQSIGLNLIGLSSFKGLPLNWLVEGSLAYSPEMHAVSVGLSSYYYKEDAVLFSRMAQAVAESLSPCHWDNFILESNPFLEVIECLSKQTSAGAKARDDSQISAFLQKGELSQFQEKMLKANPFCNYSFYPPRNLQADQRASAFTDWFAAEVFSMRRFSKSKVRVDLCWNEEHSPLSKTLSNRKRLEHIYLANPRIKEILGLKGDSTNYCSGKIK